MIAVSSKHPKLFFEESMTRVPILLEQKAQLDTLATIINQHIHKTTISLNFIDFDNSTLSHLTQVWCQFAIKFFKIQNLNCQSAGLVSTAVSKPVLKSLKQIGFDVKIVEFNHRNAVYSIHDFELNTKCILYSKQLDELRHASLPVDIDLILEDEFNFNSNNEYQLKFKFPEAYIAKSNTNLHFLNAVISAHIYYLFESLLA